MQQILIVSPTPTHPANAGNRLHVRQISTFLRKNGFQVFFLYLASEDFDREHMANFWGDNMYIIERNQLYKKGDLSSYYFNKLLATAKKFKRYFQKTVGGISTMQFKFNSEVDDYFPRGIKKLIQNLQKKHQFKIVICEYAAMSKVLTFFDRNVFKIIDAHDKFTDRFELYLKHKLQPDWISFYKDQEKKALKRADLIVALDDSERKYFEKISGKPSICFFSVPDVRPLPYRNFQKKLLYFGSGNKINVKTLEYFEKEILPQVIKRYPDTQLLVGGSICLQYKPTQVKTELLGLFDSPFDFYKLGDIVINPEQNGTGFKVKTLEALSYGMPVVCTEAGAVGLSNPYHGQLLIANTAQDFAKMLIDLIENPTLRNKTSTKAKEWINANKEIMSKKLLDYLIKN